MEHQERFISRSWRWIVMLAVAGAAVALLIVAGLRTHKQLTFTADSTGTLRLYGISLANTNARNAVFTTMGILGLRAEGDFIVMNVAQLGKIGQAIGAMMNSGILDSNHPPRMTMDNRANGFPVWKPPTTPIDYPKSEWE